MAFLFRISSILLLLCISVAPAHAADKAERLGTQLAFAAAAGTVDDVKTLLKSGADPNHAANASGASALALAAMRKDTAMPAIINALLDANADVNIADPQGQTPLFYAGKNGSIEAVKLLLAHGADLTHADNAKNTARDAAFNEGQKDAVKAMDDYITAQGTAVRLQYEERNKQLEAQGKALQAQSEALARQQAKKPETASEAEAPLKEMDITRLHVLIHDLSYHTCAAEYWRFCRGAKQETGMSAEVLRSEMQTHKTKADEVGDTIHKEFGADEAYLNAITTPSSSQILNTLSHMVNNVERKAQGVGSKDDMDARCTDIADQWELTAPGENTGTATEKNKSATQPSAGRGTASPK